MFDGPQDTRPYLEVDGERPAMLNELVRSLTLSEAEGGLSHVEIRLDNGANHAGVGINYAFEFADTEILPLGQEFRVLFPAREEGEEREPRELFQGRVSGLEFIADSDGMPELCVFGEDAMMAWRMSRATRSFDADMTIQDMIKALAREANLQAPEFDFLNDTIAARHQMNESNLSFLRRVLVDWDADVQVVGHQLQITPRADLERDTLTLELGVQLKDVRIMADLAHQRRKRSLSAYDHVSGTPIYTELDGIALGPGQGREGAEYLEPFGDAKDHIASAPVTNETEATALLKSTGARAARRFVTAQGTAVGNPKLRVGTHLTFEGIGPRFANTYYVTQAQHCYSRTRGYVTEFEAECAFFNGDVA
ncbi:MAG: hypothetical protein ABJL99_03430 [Aliishimia sp.]